MFKLTDKKIITTLRSKILLNWPYEYIVLREVDEGSGQNLGLYPREP